MKGWVKIALKRMKAAYNCNHTVGIYWDQSDTDLVTLNTVTEDKKDRFTKYYVGDVDFFFYCPDCGDRLNMKEKYKDAVEVVQMP
jgi:hypothetical protein